MTISQRLDSLLSKPPETGDFRTLNLLNGKLYNWLRYYLFLEIILARYQEASRAYLEATAELRRSFIPAGADTGKMTPDQARAVDRGVDLAHRVHLEIESFYLFAKILLDHVAGTLQFYFWRKGKWTHTQLAQQFLSVSARKSFRVTPENLNKMIQSLAEEVIEYRNEWVQHVSDPRTRYGMTLADHGAKRLTHLIYPESSEEARDWQKESGDLSAILGQIADYMGAMLDFLSANTGKSILPGHVTD